MNNDKAQTEVIRRIHIDRHCLEVGEWPDDPGCLELRAVGKNVEYFGQINLTMPLDFALAIGQALVDAAKEKMNAE